MGKLSSWLFSLIFPVGSKSASDVKRYQELCNRWFTLGSKVCNWKFWTCVFSQTNHSFSQTESLQHKQQIWLRAVRAARGKVEEGERRQAETVCLSLSRPGRVRVQVEQRSEQEDGKMGRGRFHPSFSLFLFSSLFQEAGAFFWTCLGSDHETA